MRLRRAPSRRLPRHSPRKCSADNIIVNAIAPSTIDTEANRAAMPKAKHENWVKPEDIARTVAFLCSEDNRVTSGAVVPVYGRA